MDLGAQFVYKSGPGSAHLNAWPFELMGREYYGGDKSIIYDSSGVRLNNDLANKYDEIIREPEIKMPVLTYDYDSGDGFFQRA